MDEKMKECFAPHTLMHSLFGLGLGLLLAIWFPALLSVWVAVVIMVVAILWDMMRKS